MKPIVAILTDFGTQDHYVGVMKGVMLGINPEITLVDISHDVPSHSVIAAQFLLEVSHRYFPRGTVFLVVVDPGVGSSRRAMVLKTEDYLFVGPDNGIFTPFYRGEWEAFELPVPETASNTFHGRDVFAPAAARLTLKTPPSRLGKPFDDPITVEMPSPVVTPEGVRGQIIYIDKFGNLITNIEAGLIRSAKQVEITVKGRKIRGIVRAYADVPEGELLAIIGSSERLEISVREGSAREALGAKIFDEVEVRAIG